MSMIDFATTHWTIYHQIDRIGSPYRLVATRDGRLVEVALTATLEDARSRLPPDASLIATRGWGADLSIVESWA